MMKKFAISLLFMFGFVITVLGYDGPKVASKVEKVVVFLNGAQVTRSATATVTPGTSTITFEGLSPGIDVQSIQVHADGAFTILSVKQELNFLNGITAQKRVTDLQAQQKAIRDQITLQNNLSQIYGEEEAMLLKNQVVTGQNASLDILKLKQALDFQTERLTELKKKELAVNKTTANLNDQVQKINNQIAEITKGDSKTTSDIIVTVSSKITVQAPFSISYVVHNASWYPTYDIRAKNINSPVSIAYKANVSQQCGEDWKNIKLILSTGNPSISGSKPQLNPYYLNFGMVYAGQAANITRVTGRVTGQDDRLAIPGVTVKVKGTSIGTVADMNGNYSIQVPAGNQVLVFNFIGYSPVEKNVTSSTIDVSLAPNSKQLSEVVVVGYGSRDRETMTDLRGASDKITSKEYKTVPIEVAQTENQTNVEFNIDNPYSIPSDGKQYGVEIGNYELNATYQYSVAPKLNTDVFLTAQLVDWNKYNFLSGEANLFFEDTYIGKSLLDTHASGDTLNLSLGTDKNIVVTRTLQKNLTQRQTIGSSKKETKDWQIEIKNRKNQPVNLLVEDQVPVSQNTSIEVEKQELSGGKIDDLTGKVQWTVELKPTEDRKLNLRYQVKYPKNQTVIVQ